jgi:hypothetical protein
LQTKLNLKMKNKAIFTVGLFALLVGCNKEKSSKPEIVQKDKEVFKISLNLVIPKDDSLQVFYCEHGETEFDGAKTVWTSVKGNEEAQQISFDLPEDVLPTKLRIDLSNNKNQDPIKVKDFSLKYKSKNFTAKDTMFFQYFIPNDQIDWDRKNAIAKFKIKEGETFDPQFGSREIMEVELQKLIGN